MAHGQRSGEIAARAVAVSRWGVPVSARPGVETASAGVEKRSSNSAAKSRRAHEQVDLEEALEAPGLEVAGAGEHILAVAHERLRVKHRRMLEDPHARVEQRLVVESLRGRARPVVRLPRHEQADLTPRRAAASIRRIIALSVT